ncbi:DUF2508 family protein [Phosphitispora sp. TUW77]|uniref:DUF2508 family protein n=1 Tax=Phosphitispora sp. TUW77 TaxID=3152361 RepID=UPI003AB8806C
MKDIIFKGVRICGKVLNKVLYFFEVGHARENSRCQQPELLDLIKEAHQEWVHTLDKFNYPIEEDMIDFAIYNINAAEKKYGYLIKKARKEKIALHPFSDMTEYNNMHSS